MTFSASDKLTAMAIVSLFETGRAFGKFSTIAVLDDGAGISYGFSQFTHKSGALAAVLNRYLADGGVLGRTVIEARITDVEKPTAKAIASLASDTTFRNALRAAGISDEMKQAQIEIAIERFLQPAVDECARLGFTAPLSLAVIYDSLTHGSWEKIRDRVKTKQDERSWIAEYVNLRDAWLGSIPRLATTRYRTRFFQKQIAAGNWELKLPVRVQGVTITNADIDAVAQYLDAPGARHTSSAVGPSFNTDPPTTPDKTSSAPPKTPPSAQPPLFRDGENGRQGEEETQAETRPVGSVLEDAQKTPLDELENSVNDAAAKYDQVGRIATSVTSRTDAAKSFWTAVIGSVTQTFWAVIGLVAGIPRQVWLVVAIIAAVLMVMYLYRQIALGKIREKQAQAASS